MNTIAANYPAEPETSGVIDIQGIISTVRVRIVPISIAVATVLILTLVAYLMATPSYTATARIGIERQQEDIVQVPNPQDRSAPLVTDSPTVDTEVTQITSSETLGRVVDTLKLASNPTFMGNIPDDTAPSDLRDLAISALSKDLSVTREGTSYAIDVSYGSTDPALATKIVNTTVDAYFAKQQAAQKQQREADIKLLASRLDSLKGEVERADSAVARFRAATNLVDIQNDNTSAQQAIAVLNSQLASAEADQAAAEARNRTLNAGAGETSPVLQQLRTDEARLSSQREALAKRYGPQHPALVEVDHQLEETRRQIAAEVARVRQSLASDAQVARQRTSSIVSSMGAQQGQLLQGNAASVKLAELDREATAAKSLYEALLERYRQAVARQGTEASSAYVIARAIQPVKPDSPKKVVFLAGGMVSALMAAIALTTGLQLMENGFASRREVERALGTPVLASVPDLTTLPKDSIKSPSPGRTSAYLVSNRASLYSESFRSIRTALKIGQDGQTIKSLAISSALPNEGKTTCALSLARSAALSGLKVLLIDCDLRRQVSSRQIENPVKAGLVELLTKKATLEQVLVHDSTSGAYLLPQAKDTAAEHFDLIASNEMKNLIELLKEKFDLVVLDTAPILAVADSRAVASMADATVMVIRWRKTPVQAVKIALDQLALAEANVSGTILSMVDLKWQMRARTGDELSYYRRYEKYYS